MPAELIANVERWAAVNGASRSEAIRRLVEIGLSSTPARKPKPDARETRRAYARDAAGSAVDRAQAKMGGTAGVKAHRKRKLTALPNELAPSRKPKRRARSVPVRSTN